MNTYEKIKFLCEREGFAISSLGERIPNLCISKASITGWKKGSIPRPDKIKAIADYFGVDVSYFNDDNTSNVVTGASAPVAITQGNHNTVTLSNETHTRELSEIEAELLRICEKLDTRKKTMLLSTAYKLLDE